MGELLHAKRLSAGDWIRQAAYATTYKIIDRICGDYPGDTLSFNMTVRAFDSSFRISKYQLLMLTKNISPDEYALSWSPLNFDIFKTAKKQWAGSRIDEYSGISYGQTPMKAQKIRFSRKAFYDTKGMTEEEVDVAYPEPFYKHKKHKAIPVMGYTIEQIFQFQKEGQLSTMGIYDPPAPDTSFPPPIDIKEVVMEEAPKRNPDSIKQALKDIYHFLDDTLSKDPFNEENIRLLIENCRARQDYSQCSEYFENLIRNYPDSVRAYLVKTKFRHARASYEDSSRIAVLQQAVKIDSNHYEVNYDLAISYYRLFRQHPNTYHAHTARQWFINCIELDTAELPLLKYPVIQLSNYLGDSNTIQTYQNLRHQVPVDSSGVPVAGKYNWYLPVENMFKDGTGWTTDYSVDAMQELEAVKFSLDWFSGALRWFKEPILSTGNPGKVYRFLWLRSFDEPIVIRMQKIKRNVTIYWKLPRFNHSGNTTDTLAEFKKTLSLRQWRKFEKSLNSINYWSMIPRDYLNTATDGAVWLLEASVNGRYKVTERSGNIYPKYTRCLELLLQYTDLNVPENKIY